MSLHSRCPKYWGLSFSISPSSEYPGLISFSFDRFGLLHRSRSSRNSKLTLPHYKGKGERLIPPQQPEPQALTAPMGVSSYRGEAKAPCHWGRREVPCSTYVTALFSTLLCPRRLTNPRRLRHPGSLAASSRGCQWEALAEFRGREERKVGHFFPSPACLGATPPALTICDCSSGPVAPFT